MKTQKVSYEDITPKNRIFSLIEIAIQSLKYQGVSSTLIVIYHYIYCRFFSRFISSNIYSFLGFRVAFLDIKSLTNMFLEVFTLNVYFFKSKNDRPVILDIGANIGDSVVYFKWLYPKSIIYAFEPLSNAYKLLQKNIELNNFDNVYTYNVGLGNKNEVLQIFSDEIGTSGSSTINRKNSENRLNKNKKKEEIKITKLSNFKEIAKLKSIDLIKIDIEGAEADLFKDLKNILHKTKKVIMEYHVLPNVSDNSFDNIVATLKQAGMRTTFTGFYRNSDNESNPFAFLIIAAK